MWSLPWRWDNNNWDALFTRCLCSLRGVPRKRFNSETLEIIYKERTLRRCLIWQWKRAHVLWEHTCDKTAVKDALWCGLGYIRLGQPATTLSGGEAQRIKLSTELSKRSTGRTLYILMNQQPDFILQTFRNCLICCRCWWIQGIVLLSLNIILMSSRWLIT